MGGGESKETKQLKEQNRTLQNQLQDMGNKWQEQQEQLQALEEKQQEEQIRIDAERARHTRGVKEEREAMLQQHQQANNQLQKELELARQERKEAESRGEAERKQANDRWEKIQQQAREQQEQLRREREQMENRMEVARKEYNQTIQKMTQEHGETQREFGELKAQTETISKQYAATQQQLDQVTVQNEQLTESLRHLHIEVEKHKLEKLNLDKRLERMEGKDPDISVEELREKASRLLGVDTVNKVNIGFCGAVKTGKSSLINALRHVHPDEKGAAAVGSLETTKKIKGYPFPEDNKLVFWDIPGSDVLDFNRQTYFYEQHLYVFDFLVVLSRAALTETELLIAEKAHKNSVPFAIIRSRCDEDLRNEKRIKHKTVDNQMKQRLVQNVKQNYMGQMPDSLRGVVTDVFCVSSRALEDMNDGKVSKFALDESKLYDYIQKQIRSQRYTLKK